MQSVFVYSFIAPSKLSTYLQRLQFSGHLPSGKSLRISLKWIIPLLHTTSFKFE